MTSRRGKRSATSVRFQQLPLGDFHDRLEVRHHLQLKHQPVHHLPDRRGKVRMFRNQRPRAPDQVPVNRTAGMRSLSSGCNPVRVAGPLHLSKTIGESCLFARRQGATPPPVCRLAVLFSRRTN